jgi:hypothetical protein
MIMEIQHVCGPAISAKYKILAENVNILAPTIKSCPAEIVFHLKEIAHGVDFSAWIVLKSMFAPAMMLFQIFALLAKCETILLAQSVLRVLDVASCNLSVLRILAAVSRKICALATIITVSTLQQMPPETTNTPTMILTTNKEVLEFTKDVSPRIPMFCVGCYS